LGVGIEHETVVWRGIHYSTAGPFLILIPCDEGVEIGPVVFRGLPPLIPDLIMPVGTGQHVAIRLRV
jgi:hypothetical protein